MTSAASSGLGVPKVSHGWNARVGWEAPEHPELSVSEAGFMQICVLSAPSSLHSRQDHFLSFLPGEPPKPLRLACPELLLGLTLEPGASSAPRPEPGALSLGPTPACTLGLCGVTACVCRRGEPGAGRCPFSVLQVPVPQPAPMSLAGPCPAGADPSPVPIPPPPVRPPLKAPIRANPSGRPFAAATRPRPGRSSWAWAIGSAKKPPPRGGGQPLGHWQCQHQCPFICCSVSLHSASHYLGQ